MAVLDDEESMERLSEKERSYAGQYLRLFAGHMNASLMEHLPEWVARATSSMHSGCTPCARLDAGGPCANAVGVPVPGCS